MQSFIASNIRRYRLGKGWTMAELARQSGLSSLRMIEGGKSLSPRIETLIAIARALGVTVAELYEEPPHADEPAPASDAA